MSQRCLVGAQPGWKEAQVSHYEDLLTVVDVSDDAHVPDHGLLVHQLTDLIDRAAVNRSQNQQLR